MIAVFALIGSFSGQYAWEYQPELIGSSTINPYLISSTFSTTITATSPSTNLKTTTNMPFFSNIVDYTVYFDYEELPSSTTTPSGTFRPKFFSTKLSATVNSDERNILNTEVPFKSGISIFLYVLIAGIFIFFLGLIIFFIFFCKECKILGPNYMNLNRTGSSFLLESRGTEVEVKNETLVNLPRDGRYTATNMNYPGPIGLDRKPSKYFRIVNFLKNKILSFKKVNYNFRAIWLKIGYC